MLWLANFVVFMNYQTSELPQWSPRAVEIQRERKERVPFSRVAQAIELWKGRRPLIDAMDSRERVVAPLVRLEAEELKNELSKVDLVRNEPSEFAIWKDVFMEAQDGTFLVLANALGRQLTIDYSNSYRSMNGQGKASDIIEQLQDLGSGLEGVNPSLAVEQYLAAWGSFITHQEVFMDPEFILDQVVQKNEGNYPASLFQLNQVVTDADGRARHIPLLQEEQVLAFEHRIRSLRAIRNANALNGEQREHGLVHADHAPFYWQILNHRDAHSYEAVIAGLSKKAKQVKQDTTPFGVRKTLFSLENGPHKVVSPHPSSVRMSSTMV